jgi:hypothetical protein
MTENEPMENWLSEYQNQNTRNQMKSAFSVYLAYTKKTPQQLISEFEQAKTRSEILAFQNWLLNEYRNPKTQEPIKPNTARAILTSVRAFYSSQKEPIRNLKSKLVKSEIAKGEHVFSVQDLRMMYAIGDTRDKAILSVSCSLGWEISAILDLEKDFIENLVKRAKSQNEDFIGFDFQREKTHSVQYGILTPLAIFSLEQYLTKLNKENPKQKKLFDLSEVALNEVLRRLVKESNVQTIGNVHFHLIRKWLMNALSDSGLNAFEVKLILGKEIGISDLTYLQTLKKSAFEKYKNAYPQNLSLSQNINGNAKANILTELLIKHIKAQQELTDYLKSEGLIKKMPIELQKKLESVSEIVKAMEKKNGEGKHD